MSQEKELRPCPFCGENKTEFNSGYKCYQLDCGASGPIYSDHDKAKDLWNNAYCWKEIDRLKAEVEELKKPLWPDEMMEKIKESPVAEKEERCKHEVCLSDYCYSCNDEECMGIVEKANKYLDAVEKIASLESALKLAVEGLEKYGGHKQDCEYYFDEPCLCGWEETLSKIREGKSA